MHGARLRELAASAEQNTTAGALVHARDQWRESLTLLPEGTRQYAQIAKRLEALEERLAHDAAPTTAAQRAAAAGKSRGGQIVAAAGALALLLLGKGKFLLLGLTKLKTFVSMFAFFGVYWSAFGWPLALGFVVGIYIHEMGHVAMLHRLGIAASAPMFIPGVGAFILAKQHITNPRHDAAVGLAGPVWGLGAALAAYAGWLITDASIWLAIAKITGLINLFNLLPFWQLDGSRAFHALARTERWVIVVALGVAFWLTGVKLLLVIAAFGVWRALQRAEWQGPGDGRTLATFLALIAALSWLSSLDAVV